MANIIPPDFVAPALPYPPDEYSPEYVNQFNKVLRLYFSEIDAYLRNLNLAGTPLPISIGGVNVDAFGRVRSSQPYTLFDSQNRYQKDPQFSESLTGSGTATYVGNESSIDLAVTTASGDKVIRQTYRVFPYQPGKSLQVLATFVMNQGKENLRQRVGYFNASNGVFFEINGATNSFVLRTNTSGTPSDARTVNQEDWNGDKLDGNGPSGLVLDPTKAQILYMDFEWLGVGSVRCGFIINGQIIVCHTFNNANDIQKVYMTTAILPIRYEIENTGVTASSSTMKQICSSVISEGGYDQKSVLSWARRSAVLTGVTTTFVPIVSIRLKSTNLGAVVIPSIFNAIPIGSTLDYEVALVKNPTLTGTPSWSSVSNSVEMDEAATGFTGGTVVQSTYVSGSNQGSGLASGDLEYNFALQLGASIGGTSDIYTLAARTISGTDDIIGSMSFYDLTN